MNVKITYNWLLEYLETDAKPDQIQEYLSLCGPSVEKVEPHLVKTSPDKQLVDYVFDLEVTSNRADAASVFGIAQECQAILPRFGKKAKLKFDPLKTYCSERINKPKEKCFPLDVQIKKASLCPRFTALVLSDIQVGSSDSIIKSRLNLCGINSVSNVVDISNYLNVALGQPVHIFDFDKIKDNKMILRESRKGELITTLDGQRFTLPGGDIVIEDGQGRLIDLCGIMGGLNSAVTPATKNVLLFVQTYNKTRIRQTSMTLSLRTQAASYFEKGLDPERVKPTLVYGVELLKKHCSAKIASQLVDIYPKPFKKQMVELGKTKLNKVVGVKFNEIKVKKILKDLGFSVKIKKDKYIVSVPSYRADDIKIPEDVIEEVARVHGYFNLPSNIQKTDFVEQPKTMEKTFKFEIKIKYFFKHLGLNEVKNYAMISKSQIENLGLDLADHLKISNSISADIEYMRTSLVPSLVKNMADNQGKADSLRFFEIAKTYHKRGDRLPEEVVRVGIVSETNFFDLKGIIESLFMELNIEDASFNPTSKRRYLSKNIQAEIGKGGKLGFIGKLSDYYRSKFEIEKEVFLAQLDLEEVIEKASPTVKYQPPSPYAVIKLDLTLKKKLSFAQLIKRIKNESKLLQKTELIDLYNDKMTIRLYFSSYTRNITEDEAKAELEKIKSKI